MSTFIADPNLIAACGLYCGACRRLRSGKCPGCRDNVKATWCGVKKCCAERGIATCAQCETHQDPSQCLIFNAFMAKVFGVIFNSDRKACIQRLRELGPEAYAEAMAVEGRQTLPRWGR